MAQAIADLQEEGHAQTADLDAHIAQLQHELGAAERAKQELAAEVQMVLRTAVGVLDAGSAGGGPAQAPLT